MHELANLIRAEVKDPRIGLVTLTGVELTPDYAYATVYFTVMPSDASSIEKSLAGLKAASGFLRSQIGRRVRIHSTPELRFRHDPSVEKGAAMSALIDQASAMASDISEIRQASTELIPEAVPDDRLKRL